MRMTGCQAPATLCTVPKASGAGYRGVPGRSREQRPRLCAYRRFDGRGRDKDSIDKRSGPKLSAEGWRD
jgi:hypothetical protein